MTFAAFAQFLCGVPCIYLASVLSLSPFSDMLRFSYADLWHFRETGKGSRRRAVRIGVVLSLRLLCIISSPVPRCCTFLGHVAQWNLDANGDSRASKVKRRASAFGFTPAKEKSLQVSKAYSSKTHLLFRKFIRRCYHLPSACLQGIALGRKVGTEVPIFYPAQSEPGSNRYRFDPNWLVKFTNSRTNPRKSLHSCRAECLASAFFYRARTSSSSSSSH